MDAEKEVGVMNYIYNRNTDSKGNHEVHTTICSYIPDYINRVEISGNHSSCSSAIRKAKSETGKTNFDGCYYCSRSCHKS